MPPFSFSRPGTHSETPSILPSLRDKFVPSTTLRPQSSRLLTSLYSPVSLAHTSILLIVCCVITGLLDSTVFWAYGTFVNGQTGNTILFGLGASTSHITTRPYGWAKNLVAIVSFVCGCVAFSHTTRILGKRRRGTLILSFLVQGGIVLLAAAFVQGEVVEGRLHRLNLEINWLQCLPIALLSFQAAGQLVVSRALGHHTIPTVVMTSMLHDVVTDPRILMKWSENPERNQRLGAYVAVVVGAVAGGFLSISSGRVQSTLWLVGGLKLVIAGAWGFWPAEKENEMSE